MKQISARQKYTVGSAEARLTIAFGNAQMGISRLADSNGTPPRIGIFTDAPLGRMQGRTLSIKSTVSDINNQTDDVNVAYTITGGPAPLHFGLDGVAEAEGKSVDFNLDVEFI